MRGKAENGQAKSRFMRYYIILSVLIVVLLVVIPIITVQLLTRAYDEQIRGEVARTSLSISETVRVYMEGAYSLSSELATNPSILTMDGDLLAQMLADCRERNSYIELLYITGMDGNQIARSHGELGYRGERFWFLRMMESAQPFVSESYYSMTGWKPCISVFLPMIKDGEMVAVFGMDIYLTYIQELTRSFADTENGRYSYIIDGEGVVIAHPDSSFIETLVNYKTLIHTLPMTDDTGSLLLNPDGSVQTENQEIVISDQYKAVIDAVMNGESGLEVVTEDDVVYYMSYEPIAMPGFSDSWSVVTLQDRDSAMHTVTELVTQVLIVIIIIFSAFIAIVIGFYISLRNMLRNLDKAKSEAEFSNSAKTDFLASMSHEIRTPMNAILGITEIELQREMLPADTEEALEKIYESGDLLLNIINDILDLSKIEAGKMTIQPAKYDIPSLVNDTVQLNKLYYGSKPIIFRLEIDEKTPLSLYGDILRIKQVLNNILSNAFKYTDRGEIKMKIWPEDGDSQIASTGSKTIVGTVALDRPRATEAVAPTDNDITIIFRISDTGRGMTQEQLGELFAKYTRFNVEANRTNVGTGLGMSITKRLLSLMDGEIFVESEPGKGSVFTVRLPQKRVGDIVCGPTIAEHLNDYEFLSKSKAKRIRVLHEYMPYGSVLIVDDIASNIYVTRGMLLPYELKIDTASSGFEAVEKVKSGNVYDIIFMDHMMPKMDGIEATKIIRDMGYKGYIIALTANALAGQAEVFTKNSFDGFISKPIDSRELNNILNEFIRNKKPLEVVKEARLKRRSEIANMKPAEKSQHSEIEELFIEDAMGVIAVLQEISAKGDDFSDDDIISYEIAVHGIKSALLNIGEKELSDFAYVLERACAERNFEVIRYETPNLIYALSDIVERFSGTADGGE